MEEKSAKYEEWFGEIWYNLLSREMFSNLIGWGNVIFFDKYEKIVKIEKREFKRS